MIFTDVLIDGENVIFSEYADELVYQFGYSESIPRSVPLVGLRKDNLFFTPEEGFQFSTESVQQFIKDIETGSILGRVDMFDVSVLHLFYLL